MNPTRSRKSTGGETKQRRCYICKERKPGDPCSFYAGFCTYYEEIGDSVNANYRDLKRYSVNVCDACAAELRKKQHLFGIIAWGIGFVVSLIAALYIHLTQVAGENAIYGVAAMLFFAAITGMLMVLDFLQIREGSSSPAVILAVLKKVEKDPKYQEKGNSFFSPAEYENMFPDAEEEHLTAEELMSREQYE